MLCAYGLDATDTARITPRRLLALLECLPPWARNGGQAWSTTDDLLALLVDCVRENTWVTARVAGAKLTRPRPIPRPRREPARAQGAAVAASGGQSAEPVKARTWAQAIEALAGMPGVAVERFDDG